MRFHTHTPTVKGSIRICVLVLSVFSALSIPAMAQTQAPAESHYQELPNFHRVNPRLLRGAQPREGGMIRLVALGVNTIINLRDDDERARTEELEAREAGLRYFNIPFTRLGRPRDAEVERVLSLINAPENGVVFVHCAHGADRTGVIIAIYRISQEGWTSQQAKEEANSYGLKFWQRGMKDYISDYYRGRAAHGTRAVVKNRDSDSRYAFRHLLRKVEKVSWAVLSLVENKAGRVTN